LLKAQLDSAAQASRNLESLSLHQVNGYIAGAAILGAVALEVQLKALHVKHGGHASREHHLWKLYKRLPKTLKDGAERVYQQLSDAQVNVAESVKEPLRDVLVAASNSLLSWRYRYEGHSLNFPVRGMRLVHRALLIADLRHAVGNTPDAAASDIDRTDTGES
jgi:hypothetical protein